MRALRRERAPCDVVVTRFGSIGKEDEEVRGDEPTIRLFNSLSLKTINHNNRQLRLANVRQSLFPLRQGRARARDRAGSDPHTPPGLWVPFIQSLRQSLELDTGVNHYSLALHSTARLRTRSPPSSCRFPTPP